jgi:uncharacterized protein (TIGR00730 family)
VAKAICVFSSSSETIAPAYFEAAATLGAALAERGWTLVYGGQRVGLMRACAEAARAHGGRVVGIVPEALHTPATVDQAADELIITADLRARKAAMEARADAFLALPGGFGTLEEVIEILTLKQINQHTKPLVLLNVRGFYEPLRHLFEHFYAEQFAQEQCRALCAFADDIPALFAYLDSYTPPAPDHRWY